MGRRLTPKRVEEIEHKYLEEICWNLSNEQGKLLQLLRTKDEITNDWINNFKTFKSGEMARGAERVISILFPNTWRPNSSPIGSDFMFETVDAMVHVDIKTAKADNRSDHQGKIPLGQNQVSYYSKKKTFEGKLPTEYTITRDSKKLTKVCVTFGVMVVYDKQEIVKVFLASIPNGKLYEKYGEKIIDAGKSTKSSIRYKFSDQRFELLPKKPPRFKTVYERKK